MTEEQKLWRILAHLDTEDAVYIYLDAKGDKCNDDEAHFVGSLSDVDQEAERRAGLYENKGGPGIWRLECESLGEIQIHD